MKRYYVLTEAGGLRIIEATAVDLSHPFEILFLCGSRTISFSRDELLWWAPVEPAPADPFADFDWPAALRGVPPHAGPGGRFPRPTPWGFPAEQQSEQVAFARRSSAAMGALVEATRAATPSGWKKTVLELKVRYEAPTRRYKVIHRLLNPDAGAEAVDFSDALFACTDVLHRIAVEAGQNWNRGTLSLDLDNQGRCTKAEMKYEYGTNFGPR